MPSGERTLERPVRLRWPALFQENAGPLFLLNASKRIRFANAAFESLVKLSMNDLLGKACLRKGPTEPLFRTLAPPSELASKLTVTVRRPAPPHDHGPPWWDVTFIRLSETAGTLGYLGFVEVIAAAPGQAPKSLAGQIGQLHGKHNTRYSFDLFAGSTLQAERFLTLLKSAADSHAPAWIHGEPGSGKETAARVIHHHSRGREKPFAKIDCAALQPYLIDALLFGTAGLAIGPRLGTLFLKEPSALPRDLQEKLSTWLLNDAAAPRVICSSKAPPAVSVKENALRPEFATHLAVWDLSPPPLRDRLLELPRITERVLHDLGIKHALSEAEFKALRAHRWPGNLKELREALSGVADGLPRYLREQTLLDAPTPAVPRPSLDAVLQAVEKKLLQQTLEECGNNQTEAAAKLGIPRARLIRRLAALGLE